MNIKAKAFQRRNYGIFPEEYTTPKEMMCLIKLRHLLYAEYLYHSHSKYQK